MSVNTKVNGQLVKSAGLYKVAIPIGIADKYSLEEREIGVWHNGKPIYQRTFIFNDAILCSSQSWTTLTETDATNVEEIITATGQDTIGTRFDPLGCNVQNGKFGVLQTRNNTIAIAKFTVQYTKTTDVPGSGVYASDEATLAMLGDVDINTPTDGQALVYNLSSQKWVNGTGINTEVKTSSDGQFNTVTGGLMQSCLVDLEPIQSGSGTPSPSNIRAISGHTQVQVGNCGKNKFNGLKENHGYLNSNGNITESSGDAWYYTDYIPITDNVSISTSGQGLGNSPSVVWYDENKNYIGGLAYANRLIISTSLPSSAKYIRASFFSNWVDTLQIEQSAVPTDYEPYNGYTHVINLGGTYYGGTLDAVSGVLTVTDAIIASYNGETLPSTWISDRDVYVSGTTPTIGAQVCYKLATPQTIQLDPQTLETLVGQNDVFAPLQGQSLDSLTYREVLAWDDVERAVAVKLDLSSVAPIEYTDKASQSYNQKQLFIKDNKLCQALASISSGASFTENTNFKYTTLAEIIEPLIP